MAKHGYIPRVLDTAKIKALRDKRGLTMEDAAKAAGMKGKQNWWAIEAGDGGVRGVTLATLNAVAHALGVDAKDLLK